jgi:molecular chaperone DnaJ
LKDYFAILGIKPTADNSEIKQAYRKLAMYYHPDKHQQDPEKSILYEQIREAYETLTEPSKRDEYLKERWRQKAAGIKFEDDLISGDVILKKVIELNQQLRYADPDRLNESRIKNQFDQVISDEMISILSRQNDRELNNTIFSILIDTLKPLSLALCSELIPQISKIPIDDEKIKRRCRELLNQKRHALFWEKMKLWIVLILTGLICLGIALIS